MRGNAQGGNFVGKDSLQDTILQIGIVILMDRKRIATPPEQDINSKSF